MKKKYIVVAIILFFSAAVVKAQITGGGSEKPSKAEVKNKKNGYSSFYIAYAISSKNFKSQAKVRSGIAFGFSTHRGIWDINSNMEIGLYYGLVTQITPVNSQVVNPSFPIYVFGEYMLGPSFNFKISDESNLTTYFRLGLGVSIAGTYQEFNGTDVLNEGPPVFGFKSGFGVNYTFGKLFTQFEISPGSMNYKRSIYNPSGSGFRNTITQKVKISSTRLGIGLNF